MSEFESPFDDVAFQDNSTGVVVIPTALHFQEITDIDDAGGTPNDPFDSGFLKVIVTKPSGQPTQLEVHDDRGNILVYEIILPVDRGGTGVSTTPANGQLLIGNGSGYVVTNLTPTVNQVNVSNGAGSIQLSTPQDIHTGATPTFAGMNAGGQPITTLGSPSVGTDAANKDYVDAVAQGLEWQESVIEIQTTPPGSPVTGDRYIILPTGTGAWAGQDNNIAEWNGSSWDFTTASEGFAAWVDDQDTGYVFNGTAWVTFSSTVNHSVLQNLAADDHPGHPWSAGRSGGQTLVGGVDPGDDMEFQTTSDVTKGDYIFSEMTSSGFLKNDASGIVTGGNLVTAVSRSAQVGVDIDMQGDEIKTQTLTGNTIYTISNPELGRVIILELDGVFTVTLPGTVTVLNGDYLPALGTNWLYLQCIDAVTPAYNAFWTVTV